MLFIYLLIYIIKEFILNNVIQDQSNRNFIKCIITLEYMEFINKSEPINFLYQLKKGNMISSLDIFFICNDDKERNNFNYLNNEIEYDFISKLISFEELHRKYFKRKFFVKGKKLKIDLY